MIPQRRLKHGFLIVMALASAMACGGKRARGPATAQSPVAASPAPVEPRESTAAARERPVEAREDDLAPVGATEDILSMSLEDINAQSPLADIHFEFDSAALTPEARAGLESHARWLLKYASVTILIEGHCDERGTVEYNLALADRRATASYNYLISLGVVAGRMKTISYGKEFPLDPGHDEVAWARNRRCHFLITSK